MKKYNSLDEMLQTTINLYEADMGINIFGYVKDRQVYLAKAALVNAVGGFFPTMAKTAPFFKMSRTNMIRIRDKHRSYRKNRYYMMCLYKASLVAEYTGVGLAPTSKAVENDILKFKSNHYEHSEEFA